MKQTLKVSDIAALGFMLFAFFLGAGNIIFPPLAGQLAGSHFMSAMEGFLLTAVGLPLISIIAVALSGGTWEHLSRELPFKIATLMAVLMFIIIGPAFAVPRTGLVAYEIAFRPLVLSVGTHSAVYQAVFSVIFFAISMGFCWYQGKLIDLIGKFLTPILFLGLIVLAVGVFTHPLSAPALPLNEAYQAQPMVKGFLEGYNTMDTFGGLMFGMLMMDAVRARGVSDRRQGTKYLIMAAVIAAAGLAFVYISLFYLGATSHGVAPNAANGGAILSQYVQALFGPYGQWVLSAVVLLACLTTSIGLISACSDYFARLTGWNYHRWVMVIGIICILVANIGLSKLIALSVPVLYALYPVAIALIVLTFLRPLMVNPRRDFRVVLLVAFLAALLDVSNNFGLDPYHWVYQLKATTPLDLTAVVELPGFTGGMAWVYFSLAAFALCLLIGWGSGGRKQVLSEPAE